MHVKRLLRKERGDVTQGHTTHLATLYNVFLGFCRHET
jgi:hypothetical protein